MAEERVQRRLAAILAADVVGYSRLMAADDDGGDQDQRAAQPQAVARLPPHPLYQTIHTARRSVSEVEAGAASPAPAVREA